MRKKFIKTCFFVFSFLFFAAGAPVSAQQPDEVDFTFDANAGAVALPGLFKPNIDLSGRGSNTDTTWPQGISAPLALETWQKDIGFSGFYRLQYNLWEINQLAKDKAAQENLLNNYESVIKRVNDAGGTVMLTLFATPAGLGRALDKKSTPWDMRAFKALVKQTMQHYSCDKRYNIWYEVWSTPDSESFYLGRKQDYLLLYKAVAEAAAELKTEFKVYIPVGGPSTSWWFQNMGGNSVVIPERSLIYELIRFCYKYRLPLDFISWHSYSTDPRAEEEATSYRKTGVALVRDWLSYFHFNADTTPLIIDEWNYDSGAGNVLPERLGKSYVAASYKINRLKHMSAAGLTNQIYYCLEDFQNNKEGVTRNVGVFWFEDGAQNQHGTKATYNALRMLTLLGKNMYNLPARSGDEFVDIIATRDKDTVSFILSNYCDPAIGMNYVSRSIGVLSDGERKILLKLIRAGKIERAITGDAPPEKMRLTSRLRAMVKKAKELQASSDKYASSERSVEVTIKNLKGSYTAQRYAIDPACGLDCNFIPQTEEQLELSDGYKQKFSLKPYSVTLVVLKVRPKEAEAPAPEAPAAPAAQPQATPAAAQAQP